MERTTISVSEMRRTLESMVFRPFEHYITAVSILDGQRYFYRLIL